MSTEPCDRGAQTVGDRRTRPEIRGREGRCASDATSRAAPCSRSHQPASSAAGPCAAQQRPPVEADRRATYRRTVRSATVARAERLATLPDGEHGDEATGGDHVAALQGQPIGPSTSSQFPGNSTRIPLVPSRTMLRQRGPGQFGGEDLTNRDGARGRSHRHRPSRPRTPRRTCAHARPTSGTGRTARACVGVANSTRVPASAAAVHRANASSSVCAPSSPDGTTWAWTSTNPLGVVFCIARRGYPGTTSAPRAKEVRHARDRHVELPYRRT